MNREALTSMAYISRKQKKIFKNAGLTNLDPESIYSITLLSVSYVAITSHFNNPNSELSEY